MIFSVVLERGSFAKVGEGAGAVRVLAASPTSAVGESNVEEDFSSKSG